MNFILLPLINLIATAINLYMWAVIIMVILSLLYSFGILNSTHGFVTGLNEFLYRITEPVLVRIRKFLPNTGSFDLAPIVLILLLSFINGVLGQLAFKLVTGVSIH